MKLLDIRSKKENWETVWNTEEWWEPSGGFNWRDDLCGPEGRYLIRDPNLVTIDKDWSIT